MLDVVYTKLYVIIFFESHLMKYYENTPVKEPPIIARFVGQLREAITSGDFILQCDPSTRML